MFRRGLSVAESWLRDSPDTTHLVHVFSEPVRLRHPEREHDRARTMPASMDAGAVPTHFTRHRENG